MATRTYLHTPYAKITDRYALFNSTWKIEIQRINAVFITRQDTHRGYPIFGGFLFLFIGILSEVSFFHIIALISFFGAVLQRTHYVLRIKMDVGEMRPIKSTHKRELEEIKEAIERSILHEEGEDTAQNEFHEIPPEVKSNNPNSCEA